MGEVANSEPDSVYENRNGATEPPRPTRRNHWRERDTKRGTNQGQEPETVPGERAKTDRVGHRRGSRGPLTISGPFLMCQLLLLRV